MKAEDKKGGICLLEEEENEKNRADLMRCGFELCCRVVSGVCCGAVHLKF